MKRQQKLIFTLLTTISLTVGAAEWKLLSTPEPGIRWYSAESYTLSDGTIRTYLKSEGRNLNLSPFAILIDCKKRRVRDYVAGDFGTEFFKPWQPIKPDSAGEIAYKAFCTEKPKSDLPSKPSPSTNPATINSTSPIANVSSSSTPKSTNTHKIALSTSESSEIYRSRIAARLKSNIDFNGHADSVQQATDVEVHTNSDGTITEQKIVKTSGNPDWDDAILKAVIKTEILPRDTNGKIPSVFIISFKP